jgi:hypothetical protein
MSKSACALVALAGFTVPALAGNMGADEARRFVVSHLFSFTCFEGTSGEGRVYADGSVQGAIRFGGSGPPRYATLPPGTLRVRGDVICALISGMSYEVCFDLDRVDVNTFRRHRAPIFAQTAKVRQAQALDPTDYSWIASRFE